MVLQVLESLQSLVKGNNVNIDNSVFRLNYKFTGIFLIASSVLLSSYQFFGHPIKCDPVPGTATEMLETFCWTFSTFSVLEGLENGHVGIYPGIENWDQKKPVVHHVYYQWVVLYICMQALVFYTPRYLWLKWELGLIHSLTTDLNHIVVKIDDRKESIEALVNYVKLNIGHHTAYYLKLIICETMNFLNILMQFYMANIFLRQNFWWYGWDVVTYDELTRLNVTNPMDRLFPLVTKCTFKAIGPGGGANAVNSLCLLALNVVNRKIFLFYWFWLVILAILTGANLIYRILTCNGIFRHIIIRWYWINVCDNKTAKLLAENVKWGDWFLLCLLKENAENSNFRHFLRELVKHWHDGDEKKTNETIKMELLENCDTNLSNVICHSDVGNHLNI